MKPLAHSSLPTSHWLDRAADARGQSLVETAMVLPLLILVLLGVVELGMALQHQHAVTSLSREGANLISRDTSLEDATTALASLSTRPVALDQNTRVILSVLRRGATVGTANFDRLVLYQRHEFGTYSAASRLATRGRGSFGGAPDFLAVNSDEDTSLQVTNAPAGLVTVRGGLVYVTEIFSRHTLITPIDRFGVTVPSVLYSVAYF
jgi:hypothetical protein